MNSSKTKTPAATGGVTTENPAAASVAVPNRPETNLGVFKPATEPLPSNGGDILLTNAAKITSVTYQQLYQASLSGQLAIDRDIDMRDGSVTLRVHVLSLVKFMISYAPVEHRWQEEQILLDNIVKDANNQPRQTNNSKLIAEIEDYVRLGGSTDPIWLLKIGDTKYVMVDGHRRFSAYSNCRRDKIPAIVLKLPLNFAISLSRAANIEHGQNLSINDQYKIIEDHIRKTPDDFEALKKGTLTQAEFARRLQVLPVNIGRFLARRGLNPKNSPPPIDIVRDVHRLFAHVNHRDPDDIMGIALVMFKGGGEIVKSWDSTTKKDILRRLQRNATPLARKLTPTLRSLLDQRGGDRRKHQPQHNQEGDHAYN